MKTPEEIIIWCDMMLDRHPNIEDTNFFNSIKDYMREQRPQGEWLCVHPVQEDDGGAYMCSICKTGDWNIRGNEKYCPYCGAQMQGKE